eukprot:32499-Alexandrium_andersonii.AAC.1
MVETRKAQGPALGALCFAWCRQGWVLKLGDLQQLVDSISWRAPFGPLPRLRPQPRPAEWCRPT